MNEDVKQGYSGIGRKMRAEQMEKGKKVTSYNSKKHALVRVVKEKEE